MKITKYPQSCLTIEHEGRRLLIDIGTLATAKYSLTDFGAVDAVLFTHSHADHFDAAILPQLAASGVGIYGNSHVAQSAGETHVEVVEEGEELLIAGFKAKAYAMEHCLMTDGSPAGIPNTGFLINDHLLLSGDSTEDVGVTAPVVAAPIFGPDISPKDALDLVRATKATKVLPVHYDVAGMNPEVFARFSSLGGKTLEFTVTPLKNGESAEF